MKSIFRNIRLASFQKMKLKKYFFYAMGEISLIIIGILMAVGINNWMKNANDDDVRCAYLNELYYTLEHDIEDTNGNIHGFEKWNPMIRNLFDGLQKKDLSKIDSLHLKFGTVANFIFLGQRSKTKIEELKYSSVNLIENRDLKNKLLLYQDENIAFIQILEETYKEIGEDLRRYYAKNFRGYNYGPAYPLDIEKVLNDNEYSSLVYQRLNMNYLLLQHYQGLKKMQIEIKEELAIELNKTCK